ncbi:hypothetical protein QFC19_002662 [Naganishia cerealis]|uniref:Uncharacterized protein n=1 Tax=Naganishia cerealis TaxID=610337 RepID=A0ACC2W844_9TREE|nr:hypothetical protein QFC19_002662 [Naganishia cerealis]
MQDLRTSQLPEDMFRYPSTVSGHIGLATRDERFVDATGPYHVVPSEGCKGTTESKSSRLMTAESRDPTFSSFEAFILAPSISSFTLYDQQNSAANNDSKESAGGRLVADKKSESKSTGTPKSSPLKDQVKSSMDSRRTLTSGKQSFDTVRSGLSMAEMSELGSRLDQYAGNLFTRIQESDSSRLDKARGQSSESESQSSPSKPSSPPGVMPKTRRQIFKLSVNTVSPFVVSSHPLETSVRHSPIDSYRKPQELKTGFVHVSPPGSDKTIKSFSALHRPSIDVSLIVQNDRGRVTSLGKIEESPTKTSKRSRPRTEYYALPQIPTAAALSIPSPSPHPRTKLVRDPPVSMSSDSGIPRMDSRCMNDQDLIVRLEARESDRNIASRIESAAENRNIASGYWDYSIMTGIGGSPPRDYATLLQNASALKNFSDASGGTLQQEPSTSFPKSGASDSLLRKPINNILLCNTGAPRSSSDKSLTSSSTYPDDTDELSEKGKYSGKRRARHTKRRGNRPPAMASLAAPLGENLDVDVASREFAGDADVSGLHTVAKDSETESQRLLQKDIEKDPIRVRTPEESSFERVSLPLFLMIDGALIRSFP